MQFIFNDLEEVNCCSFISFQSNQRRIKIESYKQLTKVQRYQIQALKKAGNANKKISLIIKTSAFTITREIQRNLGQRGYHPKQAQNKADNRD